MSDNSVEETYEKNRFTNLKWFFQASTGIFLIFFLSVHLYVAHINGGSPVELFNSVVLNLRNPWWMSFFLAFVWIITYHALNGVKGIIYDMGVKREWRRYIGYAFTVIYFATVIYGTLLAIIISQIIPQ